MKLGDTVIIKKRVLDDQNNWHDPGTKATVKAHATDRVQIEFDGCVFGRGRATVKVGDVDAPGHQVHNC